MPSTYQGTVTPLHATTTWTVSTVYTAGVSYVQPTSPTGQYFQCTVSGTSVTQPSWSTAASLPVPGQTYAEGGSGPTWTCMGSIVTAAPSNIAVDVPLDADPPSSIVVARGLKALGNAIKWIYVNCARLSGNNTWTGTNTFDSTVTIASGATLAVASGSNFTLSDGATYNGNAAPAGGGFVFQTALAQAFKSGQTASEFQLLSFTPPGTGVYRVDVYMRTTGSGTDYELQPAVNTTWGDPFDPSSVMSSAFSPFPIQTNVSTSPVNAYYWSFSAVFYCSYTTPIVVTIGYGGPGSVVDSIGVISGIF